MTFAGVTSTPKNVCIAALPQKTCALSRLGLAPLRVSSKDYQRLVSTARLDTSMFTFGSTCDVSQRRKELLRKGAGSKPSGRSRVAIWATSCPAM